jgi:hypothetical protein
MRPRHKVPRKPSLVDNSMGKRCGSSMASVLCETVCTAMPLDALLHGGASLLWVDSTPVCSTAFCCICFLILLVVLHGAKRGGLLVCAATS